MDPPLLQFFFAKQGPIKTTLVSWAYFCFNRRAWTINGVITGISAGINLGKCFSINRLTDAQQLVIKQEPYISC